VQGLRRELIGIPPCRAPPTRTRHARLACIGVRKNGAAFSDAAQRRAISGVCCAAHPNGSSRHDVGITRMEARMADDQTTPNPPDPTPPASPTPNAAEAAALEAARAALSGAPAGGDPVPTANEAAALDAAKAALAGLSGLAGGSSIDDMMAQAMAEEEAKKIGGSPNRATGTPSPMPLPTFDPKPSPQEAKAIDLLSDVTLNVKIELGRTRMLVEDVLKLGDGTVIELDKLAGDPVDVFVNDRPVARGEVLVLNDNFCVRINEILQPNAEPTKAS
jgi:flagellar motor switch protein FliN/FliY